MKYEIEGIYPAEEYFRIDINNGQVFLKKDLKNDPLSRTDYQVSRYFSNIYYVLQHFLFTRKNLRLYKSI